MVVLYQPFLARVLSVTSLFLSDEPLGSVLSPARVEYLALQSKRKNTVSHIAEVKTWIVLMIDRK